MDLSKYFERNDGSLPEVEVKFPNRSAVSVAFKHLYDRGARNVTVNGGYVWIKETQSEKPFGGPEDAVLVASGAAEAFHVVLGGIAGTDCPIPDLGVFVFTDSLALDYRMGSDWGPPEIQSWLELLRQLLGLGGEVSVPWWGADGERDFLVALSST
ncbi:hypothetical protein [Xanthomonas campestris]|uniref:hypothetical protein n=1 Tax=Xanthomonas campestris TaxID=339 RepID=UPI001E4081C1|nr:hypothetical protein [Xanthomonas campestris]MCC5085434.1 hypothetical protein [Xanthomonas campestris]